MDLKDFLKSYGIRTSKYGNICLNDIVDLLIFNSVCPNTKIDYYFSPVLCLKFLTRYKNLSKCAKFFELVMDYVSNNYNYLQFLSIYLISTPERMDKDEYKLGKHKGSLNKLISRYVTPLVIPLVFCFARVNNYSEIETKILEELDNFRLLNVNGNKSEWIKLDRNKILTVIHNNINKFDINQPIEIHDITKIPSFKEMILSNNFDNSAIFNKCNISIIIDANNIIWFSASDLQHAIGLTNIRPTLSNERMQKYKSTFADLKKYLKVVPSNSQPGATYINEAGMYLLLFRSDKPLAIKFTDWVIEEVIPSIRKTGSYHVNHDSNLKLIN